MSGDPSITPRSKPAKPVLNVLWRTVMALGCLVMIAALVISARFLYGDFLIYRLPPADANTNYSRALYLEQEMRKGLAANPLSWEGHIQYATYLVHLREFERVLEHTATAGRYYGSIQALYLDGVICEEYAESLAEDLQAVIEGKKPGDAEALARKQQEMTQQAIEIFERLHRFSLVDRTVYQYLLRLYGRNADYEGLERIATEIDVMWPNSFDTYIALANVDINRRDAPIYMPLILRRFVLAKNAPSKGFERPEPFAFYISDMEERIVLASEMTGFSSLWSIWE